ncbi:MAG: AMP-binding protein [Methylococcaceae bacterium]|jgi:hypothetical protein
MSNDNNADPWSAANFALIEASLWQEDQAQPTNTAWLAGSWQDQAHFWKALQVYSDRRKASPSRSTLWKNYDFYHDLLMCHKDQNLAALICFEQGQWHTYSYAELTQTVNALAATWEQLGVQAGDTLAILHPLGAHWFSAMLAGLRLGLVICILPPQGNAFVERRLANLAPQWLAIDPLYRHQLTASWQDKVLPNTLSALAPMRRSFEYIGTDSVAQCFDPSGESIDTPTPVTADSLYLGALRDSIFALGIKPGQVCAAPGWHVLESQPALIMAVLLSGATWLHIELEELEKTPGRLLEQAIDVLGVSRPLRELLQANPPAGEKPWRYWFRQPAESADYSLWQEFIQTQQLQQVYAGNVLWSTVRGGAMLFSARYRGQIPLRIMPAAGKTWQLAIIEAPELPNVAGWGRIALGKADEDKIIWSDTPYILAPYRTTWTYLGQYPRGRAARTYPSQEVVDLLAPQVAYLAIVETPIYSGDDPRQVLLVFGNNIDTQALHKHIESELGAEFLPDRIECLPLLPKLDKAGGADQAWCQQHYESGELYRRVRSPVFLCSSALKQMILG